MRYFEVTYSVYASTEAGRATIGSSLLSSLKTTIAAENATQARSMVLAQYGSTCRVFGVRPV